MDMHTLRRGGRRAIAHCQNASKPRKLHQSSRCLATPVDSQRAGDIKAAPPIRFSQDRNQFARNRPRAQLIDNANDSSDARRIPLLRRARVVPASPSYFTAMPKHTDDILHLSTLLLRYQTLPVQQERLANWQRTLWKSRKDYMIELQEPIRSKGYSTMVALLKRLSNIHPSLIPAEVTETLERFKRLHQPYLNPPIPPTVDQWGRAKAVGRRKTSSAAVFLVEGEGECLINGKTLADYFGRLHDRESAVWALKATQRLDKYNIWALVKGGGTTGQAEAIQLGVARALMIHENALKPALRRAGVLTRDPRKVERKKPGKLKARKMPAWVKR